MLRKKDIAIWEKALPYLDVRSNDVHTLHSYVMVQQLLKCYPDGNAAVVLPAILLHDTGWKKIPLDKILQSFGPKNKYPELQRQHEIEGVMIAQEILQTLEYDKHIIKEITDIIDGHDTNKEARSLNDIIVKDSDKLWRYTAHGIQTIQDWFKISKAEVLDILENFVLPSFHTEQGKIIADALLQTARMEVIISQEEILNK